MEDETTETSTSGCGEVLSFMVKISIHEDFWSELDQLLSGYRFSNS